MILLIHEACSKLNERIEALEKAHRFITSDVFDTLIPHIQELEVSDLGVLITPLGDPFVFADVVGAKLGVLFSRDKDDSGLYQWVTTVGKYDVQLWIMSNENVDLTGTCITA